MIILFKNYVRNKKKLLFTHTEISNHAKIKKQLIILFTSVFLRLEKNYITLIEIQLIFFLNEKCIEIKTLIA